MHRICVGLPYHRNPSGETTKSIPAMDPVPGYDVEMFHCEGSLIYAQRGVIADHVLQNPDIHYLFFLDSDMIPPPHALKTMLSRDADIVAALCTQRRPPFCPVIFRNWSDQANGPIMDPTFFPIAGVHDVWGSGLAATLIKRHVLERVKEKFGPHLFFHERLGPFCEKCGHGEGDPMGEDVTFFYKANKLGFRTVLDADVHVGHLADHPMYPLDAKRYWSEYDTSAKMQGWQKDAVIRDLQAKVADLEAQAKKVPELAFASPP
jgi:hypothetical protein